MKTLITLTLALLLSTTSAQARRGDCRDMLRGHYADLVSCLDRLSLCYPVPPPTDPAPGLRCRAVTALVNSQIIDCLTALDACQATSPTTTTTSTTTTTVPGSPGGATTSTTTIPGRTCVADPTPTTTTLPAMLGVCHFTTTGTIACGRRFVQQEGRFFRFCHVTRFGNTKCKQHRFMYQLN